MAQHLDPARPRSGRRPAGRAARGGAAGRQHPRQRAGRGYVRELAGMLGMDVEEVRREVMRSAARPSAPSNGRQPTPESGPTGAADPTRRAEHGRAAERPPPTALAAGAERPAARHRAGDHQAAAAGAAVVRPRLARARGRRLHPPRVRRDLPRHAAGAACAADADAPGRSGSTTSSRRCRIRCSRRWWPRSPSSRSRSRPAVGALRPGRRRQAAAADGDAAGERAEVEAAADEPGGAPDVRTTRCSPSWSCSRPAQGEPALRRPSVRTSPELTGPAKE